MKHPVLLIHGGACARKPSQKDAKLMRASLQLILQQTYALLLKGCSAVHAVTHAVAMLEDDPLFNAGTGAKIQSDGKIRLSAGLMDGNKKCFSGLVNIQDVRNPILIARTLQSKPDKTLSDLGAQRYARNLGFRTYSPMTPKAREEFQRKKQGRHGTVGAVALDSKGNLASATSTGGRGFEIPGRVSDTPTVAGTYANKFAAVSATGVGEKIVEHAVAARLCAFIETGIPLEKAGKKVIHNAKKDRADFGLIALDAQGRIFADTATPFLIYGSACNKGISTKP